MNAIRTLLTFKDFIVTLFIVFFFIGRGICRHSFTYFWLWSSTVIIVAVPVRFVEAAYHYAFAG